MKAVFIQQPHDLKIMDQDIPFPAPAEIQIQVMASGICGTDIHIYNGEYLGDYPVIPGHEFSGMVTSIGNSVTRFQVGDRVAVEPNIPCDNCIHCLNNHQNFCQNWQAVGVTLPGGMEQFVTVPEKAAFSIGDLSFAEGAFMEPLSCVIHGVQRARISLADQVLILGAGPIGNLLMQVIRLQGATQISLLENNPGRAELALEMGAHSLFTSLEEIPIAGFDVVVDATGVIPLMNRSIDFARPGGTVLLFGVPPAGKIMEIEAFKVFQKGLTILSSFTSIRNSYQAVHLIQSGLVNVKPLISHTLPLQDMQAAVDLIQNRDPQVMKVILLPNE